MVEGHFQSARQGDGSVVTWGLPTGGGDSRAVRRGVPRVWGATWVSLGFCLGGSPPKKKWVPVAQARVLNGLVCFLFVFFLGGWIPPIVLGPFQNGGVFVAWLQTPSTKKGHPQKGQLFVFRMGTENRLVFSSRTYSRPLADLLPCWCWFRPSVLSH